MKNRYLDEKFDADPRPGVVASLTASSLSKMQYQQRLDALHTLHNCDTSPAEYAPAVTYGQSSAAATDDSLALREVTTARWTCAAGGGR